MLLVLASQFIEILDAETIRRGEQHDNCVT
jgi:hypothetical protein